MSSFSLRKPGNDNIDVLTVGISHSHLQLSALFSVRALIYCHTNTSFNISKIKSPMSSLWYRLCWFFTKNYSTKSFAYSLTPNSNCNVDSTCWMKSIFYVSQSCSKLVILCATSSISNLVFVAYVDIYLYSYWTLIWFDLTMGLLSATFQTIHVTEYPPKSKTELFGNSSFYIYRINVSLTDHRSQFT